ncbi:hypothetical protein [Pyrococcus yayanosii]|uniref:Uncharacterized protein n=1 Tax=Pyrococcus yayanosii (strain CH1 / JCM 16557) TaxID=529709 RepID=F8AFG6_PYRYC|nr:hypothetical protein [Pyrococcus yayanosii]AEH23773.1 hypothetical protein PYCH_00600 [Pyrococcus yayanosii CH1]
MIEGVIKDNIESDTFWLVIIFKTPLGPSETMERIAKAVENAGWKVTFKANWWTADIPYGLVRIDAKKNGREKIILGKWILGREWKVIRAESLELEKGKDEFFRTVDSITSTLIHDPVIRTMREQY